VLSRKMAATSKSPFHRPSTRLVNQAMALSSPMGLGHGLILR
jgi:hypothetical protein